MNLALMIYFIDSLLPLFDVAFSQPTGFGLVFLQFLETFSRVSVS